MTRISAVEYWYFNPPIQLKALCLIIYVDDRWNPNSVCKGNQFFKKKITKSTTKDPGWWRVAGHFKMVTCSWSRVCVGDNEVLMSKESLNNPPVNSVSPRFSSAGSKVWCSRRRVYADHGPFQTDSLFHNIFDELFIINFTLQMNRLKSLLLHFKWSNLLS